MSQHLLASFVLLVFEESLVEILKLNIKAMLTYGHALLVIYNLCKAMVELELAEIHLGNEYHVKLIIGC